MIKKNFDLVATTLIETRDQHFKDDSLVLLLC